MPFTFLVDPKIPKKKSKSDSIAENILQFEEKKAKILEDAGDIDLEEYLKSKGISEDK